jgi:hypothetical protein
MLNVHEGKKISDGFSGDWPWYVAIAVERVIHFLEAVGRSVERGNGTFGFMVSEDICSPGSSRGVHAMPAPVATRSISWETEFRED